MLTTDRPALENSKYTEHRLHIFLDSGSFPSWQKSELPSDHQQQFLLFYTSIHKAILSVAKLGIRKVLIIPVMEKKSIF